MLVVKRVYHLLTLGNFLIASFSGCITKFSKDQFFTFLASYCSLLNLTLKLPRILNCQIIPHLNFISNSKRLVNKFQTSLLLILILLSKFQAFKKSFPLRS